MRPGRLPQGMTASQDGLLLLGGSGATAVRPLGGVAARGAVAEVLKVPGFAFRCGPSRCGNHVGVITAGDHVYGAPASTHA